MIDVSRRGVLAGSLALGVPSIPLGGATLAPLPREITIPPRRDPAAVAPREELLFDAGWRFALGHGSDPAKDFGFGYGQSDFAKTGDFKIAKPEFDHSSWRRLDLPHDWAVELPFVHDDRGEGDTQMRSHGYKPLGRRYPETSIGWYRRSFDIPEADRGRRIWLEFDGVMRDALVLVNGCYVGRNPDGYAPFRYDLTNFLFYGGRNIIVVRVDASYGSGWFYEGAGIYRHVWLTKHDAVHLGKWDSVVRPTLNGSTAALDLSTIIENESERPARVAVDWTITDAGGRVVARANGPAQTVAPGEAMSSRATTALADPQFWSVEAPNLYVAVAKLIADGAIRDADRVTFGVRTARFDPDHGFSLNGKPVKIRGTCNHQDHAGVGAALPDALQRYRLEVLRQMGCNAVRTSHNAPTPEWVEACDRLGVMMMCETRQFSANPEALAQLDAMVKRFRNSPSIILWSIGNEEWVLQEGAMAGQGARIAATMVERCHALDPTRPVTVAANGNNEQGVSEPVDVVGFNYHPEWPESFHKKFPKRPIVGSETSSAVSTRGEYATDAARNIMSSFDGVVSWGQTPEQWWKLWGSKEWAAGGFAWTGFDYRGEPTPYGWPSNSSQFGIVDLCGFPKDYYYYYKAWWGREPSLHLFPHWNWPGREGNEVAVWVYSNLDEVELLLNGRSLGTKRVPHLGHVAWQVPYQPGVIEAVGRRGGRMVLRERRETTGPGRRLRLTSDRSAIDADGRDAAIVKVDLLDSRGRPVPTANDKLAFRVSGAGRLIGVGNGNPNSLESDKAPKRALFNGLAQLIVQSTGSPGEIRIKAVADEPAPHGFMPAILTIPSRRALPRPVVPVV
jgi:beta-galactosidase